MVTLRVLKTDQDNPLRFDLAIAREHTRVAAIVHAKAIADVNTANEHVVRAREELDVASQLLEDIRRLP